MLLARHVMIMLSIGMLCAGANVVSGQNYPNKPIRIVSPPAGGGADWVARIIAQEMSSSLGQPVIVDNRAGGIIPAEIVARAPADGYTLLLSSVLWVAPLMQKVTFDPLRDFLPVTLAVTSPNILVVYPSVSATSTKELIAVASAKPGQLNFGSGPRGSSTHLAVELFRSMAGVNIVTVPYKGIGPVINDLIAGHVEATFTSVSSVMPHVKSGRLRALAITSARPSTLAPGLPTVAASGVPGYEIVSNQCIFVRAGVPAKIVDLLHHEIVRIINGPDLKEKLFDAAWEPVGSTPQQLVATIKSEVARLSKVIKDAGIRSE